MKEKLEKIEKLLAEAKTIATEIEAVSTHAPILRARISHALELLPHVAPAPQAQEGRANRA